MKRWLYRGEKVLHNLKKKIKKVKKRELKKELQEMKYAKNVFSKKLLRELIQRRWNYWHGSLE